MNYVQIVIIQAIVFGILIFFLRRIMIGNTESAVNRLDQSYAEVNKKKEEITVKIQQVEAEYQKRKEEAEKIATKIRQEAEEEIRKKQDEALKKAKDEAERIVGDAMSMRERIRDDLRKEEKLRMIDVCEELLRSTLKDNIMEKVNVVLIDDFLKEMAAVEMSQIPVNMKEVELVVSAHLDVSVKAKINDAINKKLRRSVTIKEIVDPNVIGGIMLRFGSLALDSSIAGKLREVATAKKGILETSA